MTAIADVLVRGLGAKELSVVQYGDTTGVAQALTNTKAAVDVNALTGYVTRCHKQAKIAVDIDSTNKYLATCVDPGFYRVRATICGTYATAAHSVSLEWFKNAAAFGEPAFVSETVSDNDAHINLDLEAFVPLVAGDTVQPMLVSSDAGPTDFTIKFCQIVIEKIG